MTDPELVAFLQWALPRLSLRWAGFRKVRGQVRKRIARRLGTLGLPDLAAYRAHLERDPSEWDRLAAMCRITISRFWRDRGLFEWLTTRLPALAPGGRLRAWSAGCAGGEEPYSLALAARLGAGLEPAIIGTDLDPVQIERARRAVYPQATLRELPQTWRDRAFEPAAAGLRLGERWRAGVELQVQDLRTEAPPGPFDLVLCRYLAFTYFDPALQAQVASRIRETLRPGGLLVLGKHESLPNHVQSVEVFEPHLRVYRVA